MLIASHLSKSYGQHAVLHDVSFTINSRTINAVVGENGAGKSTLLKIIIGELKADHGSVEVNGTIGYCPQTPLIFSTLTVEENFRYFATAYGLTKHGQSWLSKRNHLMDRLNFSQYLHFRTEYLSGGTQQKLNLSLALLHDPDLLILDEPYGAFDMTTYQHFKEIIYELRDEGKCLLLVTHLLNSDENFDQVFTLKQGGLQ